MTDKTQLSMGSMLEYIVVFTVNDLAPVQILHSALLSLNLDKAIHSIVKNVDSDSKVPYLFGC